MHVMLKKIRAIPLIIIIPILCLVPLLPFPPAWMWVLTIACYYGLLSVSWNMIAGYAGQFSFAHTALLAIGGYTSVLLHQWTGVSPFVGLLTGGVTSAAAGFLVGLLCLRLRGIYFVLTTFGFSMITYLVVLNEYQTTGGKAGLKTSFFLEQSPYIARAEYYYMSLLFFALSLIGTYFLMNSKYGLFLQAIRDDEESAAAYGIHLVKVKVSIFVISSFIVGLAGSFYAHLIGYISPAIADLSVMASIITITVLGGLGTFYGPVAGCFIIWPLSELIRSYSGPLSQILFAVAIILTLKFFRNGLVGLIEEFASKRVFTTARGES